MTLVTKHNHPLVNVIIDRIAEQKAKRLAWDGQYYTRDEFLDTYGEEVGLQFWREAPHYGCLEAFKREWGVGSACCLHGRIWSVVSGIVASGSCGALAWEIEA